MDDLRGPFSKLKKDIKHRLTKDKHKPAKPGTDVREEGSDASGSPGSLPRPEVHAVTSGGHEQEGDEPNAEDESVGPGVSTDGNKTDWRSTASASARLVLRGVRDSADAFAPLKSVAGGLYFILENCEVWSLHHALFVMLTDTPAHEGKQAGDRIVSTPGPSARKIAVRTGPRG